MEWQFVVALLVFMPVILIPAILVWYLNVGGVYQAVRNTAKAKGVPKPGATKISPGISHRSVWIGLMVAAAFGVYGLGLWARWGGTWALVAAVATPALLVPLMFAAGRPGKVLTALVMALVPPGMIWFLMGGVGWQTTLGLMFAIPLMIIGVASIWYLNASGLYRVLQVTRQRQKARVMATGSEAFLGGGAPPKPGVVSSGVHETSIGRDMFRIVVLALVVLVPPALVWVVLGRVGWQVALAVSVVLPVMLMGVAFIWYLNVSGLYLVLRESRQRNRGRARVVSGGGAASRGSLPAAEAIQVR